MRKMIKHNPVARSLASNQFAKRVVAARKGAGSYKRKARNAKREE